MTFTQQTFSPVGANSTQAPAIYAYKTADTQAAVAGADYFENKVFSLKEGDFVLLAASDGFAVATVNADKKSVTLSIS